MAKLTGNKQAVIVVEENPRIELVVACGDILPPLLSYKDDLLVKIGAYASPGNRYRYIRAVPVQVA